jgi:DNA-binding response OmpR family regulator
VANIHISDDEPDMRHLLAFLLSEMGHEVTVSIDGRDAIESMLVRPPDLLILDLMMPDMDGYAVLGEMHEYQMLDSTRVLVLSARSTEDDRQLGFELGADEYVTKPWDEGELKSIITTLLEHGKEELRLRREDLRDKARLLAQLETVIEQGQQTA